MGPITCVLFDFDDTLVPTFPLRAQALAYAAKAVLGRDIDGAAFLREGLGENIERTAARLAGDDASQADLVVRTYRDRYYATATEMLAPFPGIPETLLRLQSAGVRIAVVSSKVRWGVEQELRHCRIRQFVEHIVGGEDVETHKPSPEPLLRALAAVGASAAHALGVGDAPADIGAARAAGVLSGAALWGSQYRDVLLALGPDFAFASPCDVLTAVLPAD